MDMVLEHTEEADSALVQLIALRKQNRKKGLLEAKRCQLLIRTRYGCMYVRMYVL